jgi:SNF2 family DNA or RNA helicase
VQRIWIPFHDASKEQQEQYKEFAAKAEITIEENQLSATSILAEYTRLRQFAIARQNLEIEYRKRSLWNPETESREAAIAEALNVFPTGDCIRKETIERLLGDYGILDNRLNGSHRQALIFSQFTKVVNMLAPWLMDELKLRVGVMTGETSQQSRPKIVRDFEKGGVYDVLLMNTTAGGLSITLNNSDLIIINDETFNPDDQTQAMDRNRDNSADIWILGTGDTIEQHIVHSINQDKRIVNWNILDARRRGLRA